MSMRWRANRWVVVPAEIAMAEVPKVVALPAPEAFTDSAYFVEEVRQQIFDELGSELVLRGGLRIETTLDARLQREAVAAVRRGLDGMKKDAAKDRRGHGAEGALVSLDVDSGDVLAMVGGYDFAKSRFNRAVQAKRQPGSAFKPFVYATALDNGYTPSSIILDETIEIDQGNGEIWRPENFEGHGTGPHTLRYGIEHSKNMMTVRLAKDVGMPLIVEYAKRFGIYDDMAPYLSLSLGAGETTLMRMVAGYAMLDNGGKRIKPSLVDRIQDRWGRTIYRHDERQCIGCDAAKWDNQSEPKLIDKREQVLDPLTAYQITSIMEGVVLRGTGQSIKAVGKHLAGKTGTTNEAKDLWFVGFSPDLAVGVYIGYDRPRSLGSGKSAQAATYAAPIFRDFMALALKAGALDGVRGRVRYAAAFGL